MMMAREMMPMIAEGPESEAPAPPASPDGGEMGSELEMHMTTLMNAMKAGQARKAANALKNFITACGAEEEPEDGGGVGVRS